MAQFRWGVALIFCSIKICFSRFWGGGNENNKSSDFLKWNDDYIYIVKYWNSISLICIQRSESIDLINKTCSSDHMFNGWLVTTTMHGPVGHSVPFSFYSSIYLNFYIFIQYMIEIAFEITFNTHKWFEILESNLLMVDCQSNRFYFGLCHFSFINLSAWYLLSRSCSPPSNINFDECNELWFRTTNK